MLKLNWRESAEAPCGAIRETAGLGELSPQVCYGQAMYPRRRVTGLPTGHTIGPFAPRGRPRCAEAGCRDEGCQPEGGRAHSEEYMPVSKGAIPAMRVLRIPQLPPDAPRLPDSALQGMENGIYCQELPPPLSERAKNRTENLVTACVAPGGSTSPVRFSSRLAIATISVRACRSETPAASRANT
jgi:hypothetical protein